MGVYTPPQGPERDTGVCCDIGGVILGARQAEPPREAPGQGLAFSASCFSYSLRYPGP